MRLLNGSEGLVDQAAPPRSLASRGTANLCGFAVRMGLTLLCAPPAARSLAAQAWPDAATQRARSAAFVAQRANGAGRPLRLQLQPRVPVQPRTGSLAAAWQPLGPLAVTSASYGNVTGRVTAIVLDPNDATGNTAYVGTTGGGVWKSVNAAGRSLPSALHP